jgi:fucose 4-O-acetylase-like acetyltransferase
MEDHPMEKQREHHIDLLKAVAIVLVVLGHSIQYTTLQFDEHPIFRLIYSFHMPLFMFVSGYLAYRTVLSGDYIGRRFRALGIPFFAWLALNAFFRNYGDLKSGDGHSAMSFLWGAIKSPDNGGLWFLIVLFEIDILYYLAQRTRFKYALLLLVIVSLYGMPAFHVPLWFGLGLVRWHLFFFALGLYFKEYQVAKRIRAWHLAFLLPVLCMLEYSWGRTGSFAFGMVLSVKEKAVFDLAMNYLVGIVAVVCAVRISFFYDTQTRLVKWLSANTLPIYATHSFVLSGIVYGLDARMGESALRTGMVFVTTIGLSTVVIHVVQRNRVLASVLFGKR